jgi:uncharacterized integral membrane protein
MADETRNKSQISAGIIGMVVLAILLVIFIFQNTERVPVKLYFWEFNGQMWVVLLGTAVVTLVLAEIGTFVRKRRRR